MSFGRDRAQNYPDRFILQTSKIFLDNSIYSGIFAGVQLLPSISKTY